MSPRVKFDREFGGLVDVETYDPPAGETMTGYMERINRERREAEARNPMLDISHNPWLRDHWNVTNQMRITNRNPDLADELRRQAGLA